MQMVARNGNAWKLIIEQLDRKGYQGRTPSSVRNRHGRISKAEKERREGKTHKNKCQVCNEIKKGHICRGPRHEPAEEMTLAQPCEKEEATTAAAPFPVPALSSVRIFGAGLPSDTLPTPYTVATIAPATRRGGLRPKALLSTRSPDKASTVRNRGNTFSSADRVPLVPLVSTNSFSTLLSVPGEEPPPVLSNTLSFSNFLGEQPGGPPPPPPHPLAPPPFHFAFPAIVGPQPPPLGDTPALSAGDVSAGEPPLLSSVPCLSFNSLAHLGDLLQGGPPPPRASSEPNLSCSTPSLSFSTLLCWFEESVE